MLDRFVNIKNDSEPIANPIGKNIKPPKGVYVIDLWNCLAKNDF